MKIVRKRRVLSLLFVIGAVLSVGSCFAVAAQFNAGVNVLAYTSAMNSQTPISAPAGYVVTIPDTNLKAALNAVIAAETSTSRTPDQTITAGEMKTVTGRTASFNETGAQNFLSRRSIKNLEGLQFLVNAETINLGINLLSNEQVLQPLSGLTKLKHLNLFHTFRDGNSSFVPPAAILAPIKDLPALESLHLNTNNLTAEHLAVLKNTPQLKTMMVAGNNITNLQTLLGSGFAKLNQTSTFSSQKHTITVPNNQSVFKNPIISSSGTAVPITETAEFKNADSNGALNPNGEYIKIIGLYGSGSKVVRWHAPLTAQFGTQKYTGELTINYNLPPMDATNPVFSPAAPAKIISRKGVAITITDVTATDADSGLNAAGVTNNAAAINLNPANPAAGNYTLRYSATDNANNTATVDREIEITDADALQAKVAATTDDSLSGYTTDSKKAVTDKKAAAEAIIAKNDATQAQINQVLAELNQAIADLKVDTRKLEAAAGKYNAEPEHIQQDPAVQTALTEANRVLNDPAKTPASVDKAARDLIKAFEDAAHAESDRQTAATNALNEIEGEDKKAARTPSAIQATKDKINAVKDEGARDSLLLELKAVEDAIQHLQAALDNLRADKKPLADAEEELNSQPDYIKNNPAVAAAFRKAQGTRAMANPSVQQVKDDAKALENAFLAAIRVELNAQQSATTALQQATDKLKEKLAPGELPAIDIAALEQNITKIQDAAKRTELEEALEVLRTAFAGRKRQVDAYSATNPAVQLLSTPHDSNKEKGAATGSTTQAPNTGHKGNTVNGLIIAAVGFMAALGGVVSLVLRKRR